MCSVVEETNVQVILAVMNTTELVIEIKPEIIFLKKFRPIWYLNL